ncbi:MAG: transcriptional regulator [Clostridiaceae bacterium]|nr:transcriptional regulator [Clostridiaceae bacterium]
MQDLSVAPGVLSTPGRYYCGVEDVMNYLGCKENKAYELIRNLRAELVNDGKLTPSYPQGKVPKKYFMERCMIEE